MFGFWLFYIYSSNKNKIKNFILMVTILKLSVLIDHNKIPHIIDISKGSVHDAKIMERIIK